SVAVRANEKPDRGGDRRRQPARCRRIRQLLNGRAAARFHRAQSAATAAAGAAYFSWSATLSSPALTQASSFSPPGAPETPTAPITSSPILIGNAPWAATTPLKCTKGSVGLSLRRCAISPEGTRKVRAV